jgi:hypothetical protein
MIRGIEIYGQVQEALIKNHMSHKCYVRKWKKGGKAVQAVQSLVPEYVDMVHVVHCFVEGERLRWR